MEKGKRYVIDNAQLMAEWDWEKNGALGLDPSRITLGNGKKVWWKCEKGHEWKASILNRAKGSGCPYCSNRYALPGYNDLATVCPDVAKEWNYDKNGDLLPTEVTFGSHKKVWWKCDNGHEWEADVQRRTSGHNCPYCSGRYAITGENDLQTVNPTLSKEWHFEKNGELTPTDVSANSGRKVWWKCGNGHEWQATIGYRNNGGGCPYCSNKAVLIGFNDLQTVNPGLSEEWNYDKNGGLTPRDVLPNSGKKVWWKCRKGHEWQAKIYHRNKVSGCPICHSERSTSLPEFALLYYLQKIGLEVLHSYKEYGYELDIYIPSKKIAIEYDGYFWHGHKGKMDLEKNRQCKKDGITLYRIREGLPSLNDTSIDYVINKDRRKELDEVIEKIILVVAGVSIDIDLDRDAIAIENLREYTEKENSVLLLNPELATEWNYERNGELKPEFFAANSGKKVWWKCSKGHEWQAVIAIRNKGIGCPYCSGRRVIKGENDLQTVNPNLAKEWHYEKNEGLTPCDVLPNSEKKAWWKCSEGHEWQAMIGNRHKGRGCPYCAGRRVLIGYNDLTATNPELAFEWHPTKNGSLSPTMVYSGSNKKVWWKCDKGHEWQASIYHRSRGNGCPICATIIGAQKCQQTILLQKGSIAKTHPHLLEEWDYKKNTLLPEKVVAGSGKKVWWICKTCGQSWETSIKNRARGSGCLYCSNQKVVKGYNDLQTVNPTLAEEWNYEKNGELTPDAIAPNSHKKIWWKCDKGHEWQATISGRNTGKGCPYCANRIVLQGYNDLATTNKNLASEWHPTKNGALLPTMVSCGSNKKVWWKCSTCSSEWQAVIAARDKGSGCPQCYRERRKKKG